MSPRQYRPGSRRKPPSDGKMTPNRLAWLRVVIGQFVVMKDTEEDKDEETDDENGPTYRLYIPRPGGRPVSFNITALTHEEFLAFKKLLNYLFDLAEPVILKRDRIAQDAFDKGDDSFARSYRQVPQLIIREGPVGEDGKGVWQRPDDLLDGNKSQAEEVEGLRVSDGGVRGAGDELAPGEPETPLSEDDEQTPN